jgi:hypothetical protein
VAYGKAGYFLSSDTTDLAFNCAQGAEAVIPNRAWRSISVTTTILSTAVRRASEVDTLEGGETPAIPQTLPGRARRQFRYWPPNLNLISLSGATSVRYFS